MVKQLQKAAKIIQTNLVIFLLLSIILGVAFGWANPAAAKGLKSYTTLTLFIMLYPMMIGLRIEEVGKAMMNLKLISLSMLFNFVLSPLLAALLAYLFLRDRPDFAVGLILTGTVPCAGMVAGWTGYAKGNVALSLVIVALSLLVSIVMIPVWMPILAGVYVQIDALAMFKQILLAVVVPLILGDLTRRAIFRLWGKKGFMEVKPILPGVSMLGMYIIVFISMALEANNVLHNPQYFLIILIPLTFFYAVLFSGSVLFSRWAKFTYEDMVAFAYGTAGKNISIALALATIFFGPLTVLVLALKPIIQISFMAIFLRLAPGLQKWFAPAPYHHAVTAKGVE
ncbi:MAG: arsenic resistance protein [Chloroflexi bacterium]|nr:MAG: arsenic resistance protein [Chloroflexota bacterium]